MQLLLTGKVSQWFISHTVDRDIRHHLTLGKFNFSYPLKLWYPPFIEFTSITKCRIVRHFSPLINGRGLLGQVYICFMQYYCYESWKFKHKKPLLRLSIYLIDFNSHRWPFWTNERAIDANILWRLDAFVRSLLPDTIILEDCRWFVLKMETSFISGWLVE